MNIFTVSPYIQNDTQWNDWARTVVGLRSDLYQFDVVDRLDPSQSGNAAGRPREAQILADPGAVGRHRVLLEHGHGLSQQRRPQPVRSR